MRLYTVFMPRVARALQARGFKIIKVAPNNKNPKYSVYIFEDTAEFQQALYEVLNEHK